MKTLILSFLWIFLLTPSESADWAWSLKNLTESEVQGPVEVSSLGRTHDLSLQCVRIIGLVRAHKHLRHTETIIILEGSGVFHLGEDAYPAGPGDIFLVPRGIVHSLIPEGVAPVTAVTTFSPPFDGKDRIFVDGETSGGR